MTIFTNLTSKIPYVSAELQRRDLNPRPPSYEHGELTKLLHSAIKDILCAFAVCQGDANEGKFTLCLALTGYEDFALSV